MGSRKTIGHHIEQQIHINPEVSKIFKSIELKVMKLPSLRTKTREAFPNNKAFKTTRCYYKFFIKEEVTEVWGKSKLKGISKPYLTAIQCHEIEMSMALQSVLFLSCLISLHVKHLEDPYINYCQRKSSYRYTTPPHTSKHLSRYKWVKGMFLLRFYSHIPLRDLLN